LQSDKIGGTLVSKEVTAVKRRQRTFDVMDLYQEPDDFDDFGNVNFVEN